MALSDSYVKRDFDSSYGREEEHKRALLDEMGLKSTEVDKLRSTMLNHDEAVCAKQEELERIRQHKGQRDHWEEFVDAKRRMGNVLHHSTFFIRLRTIVPSLIIAPGAQRHRLGFYLVRNMPTDAVPGYRGFKRYIDCPIYLGWVDEDYVPEYEIDLVNEVGVAVGQRRGWRTILLRLVVRKDERGRPDSLITERQADEAFGRPTGGSVSFWYRKHLYEFRNGR